MPGGTLVDVADLEQHFLRDAAALAWIVDQLDPRRAERVVELGAGAGTVAGALLRRVAVADLTLVELDPALAAGLRRAFPGARIEADDWRTAWPGLGPLGGLVVSLPDAHAQGVIDAIADRPPRVTLLAVAAGRSLLLPASLSCTARRPLPAAAFDPPQPFDGELLVLRPAGGAGGAAGAAERT